MAFSPIWGLCCGIFFFPVLVGQISAGLKRNAACFGYERRYPSNPSQRALCTNAWVRMRRIEYQELIVSIKPPRLTTVQVHIFVAFVIGWLTSALFEILAWYVRSRVGKTPVNSAYGIFSLLGALEAGLYLSYIYVIIFLYNLRRATVDKYKIDEAETCSCCVSFFCLPCSADSTDLNVKYRSRLASLFSVELRCKSLRNCLFQCLDLSQSLQLPA